MRVASVVQSDVSEQIGHGLAVVDAPDGLSQDHTHVHGFDFWTLELLHIMRHRVGDHDLQVNTAAFISLIFHDDRVYRE